MLRVVLDTNQYISALAFGGAPREILERAGRDYHLLVSAEIKYEVTHVLADKFKWPLRRITAMTDPLWEFAEPIAPQVRLAVARDDADNRIIECAVEGTADIIVSRDNDLLTLNPYEGIYILQAHEFLAVLNTQGSPGTVAIPTTPGWMG